MSYVLSFLLVGNVILSSMAIAGEVEVTAPSSSTTEVVRSMLEVTIPDLKGVGSLQIPLYEVGVVQYFSAGVGIEERQARYPAFPLKLILVEGERAYTTGVALTIINNEGREIVSIPEEHVVGPWVFVKAPPGTYTVTATHGKSHKLERQVKIHEQRSSTVYFRWPHQ